MKRKILQLHQGTIKASESFINRESQRQEEQKRLNKALSEAFELGMSIALPIVAGVLFGRYLDHIFGTSPKLTLSFLFLGVIIGGIRIIKLAREDAI